MADHLFYHAPHSRVEHSRTQRSTSVTSSRRLVSHSSVQRHIAVDAPPKMRYAGYFNERRSAAPKFPTASRFGPEPNRDDDTTPGPAAYNTARSTIRRDHGVRFSTAVRGEPISRQMDVEEAPGPGAYNTVVSSFAKAAVKKRASSIGSARRGDGLAGGRVSHHHSSASSRHADPMARFDDNDDTTPGPGAYRVQLARNAVARHTPSATIGRASRFDDTFYGKRVEPDEPSSATYAPRVTQRGGTSRKPSSRAGTIPKAPRFAPSRRDDDDFAPGPGAYSPLYGLV